MIRYNFCPGPAMLPGSVIERTKEYVECWPPSELSILSTSHRGEAFKAMISRVETNLSELLHIPENYRILFMHGGATGQFAAVPMNLTRKGKADYILTGYWANEAYQEAKNLNLGALNVPAKGVESALDTSTWDSGEDVDYVYCVPNETLEGIECYDFPTLDVPLVGDFSSTILSRPFDVSKFGVIFAGAQKNMGTAGVTVAIVREDLIAEPAPRPLPKVFDYYRFSHKDILGNTQATLSWVVLDETLKWLKSEGGVEAIAKQNQQKAKLLYQAIDQTDFYDNAIPSKVRSRMNVPIAMLDKSLETRFLSEATKEGLVGLKGHWSRGGIRVSMYNAMPPEGIVALADFMQAFEKRYG